MIKAIIFDWGGVLINKPSIGLIKYFANYFKVKEDDLKHAVKSLMDSFQKGKISEENFWKIVCNKLNVNIPKVESLWEIGFKEVYREKTKVLQLIRVLKKNGYKIGFLSNTEIPSMNFFFKQKYKIFDVLIFSCMEGYRKPEENIFKIMIKKLKVLPYEAIFIDDKQENIIGAKNVGFKWYTI